MSGILQMVFAATSGSGPINTVAPVVTGTAQVRQTLTCSTGTWAGAAPITYAYQWQQGTTDIVGATTSTYVIPSTYVGIALRCVVTATNIGGSIATSSNATSAVAANIPVVPTIGTATSISPTSATVAFTPGDNGGATVTAYTATSSPGGITGSSTGSPITVSGLSENTAYTFTVTATNSVGTTAASSASNSITTGVTPPVNIVAPVISGTGGAPAIAFSVWTCSTGTWTGSPTAYIYVWYAGGTVVQAGPSPNYTIASADVGKTLQCYVTASNSGGATAAGSNTSAVVIPNVPKAPTIGTATATGSTTATVAFTAGDNGGAAITSYTARTQNPGGIISTGTSSPITVTGLSPYTTYTFIVAATNSVGTGSYSNQSNQITTNAVAPVNISDPSLSGTTQVRENLYCNMGTWSGTPSPTYSYQWQSNGGVDIPGATGSSYNIESEYVGSNIRCKVTATNPGGSAVAYTVYATAVSANTPLPPDAYYASLSGTLPGSQVSIYWTPSTDDGGASITRYRLYVSTNGGAYTFYNFVPTTASSPIVLTLNVPFTNISYAMAAENSVGVGPLDGGTNTVRLTSASYQAYIAGGGGGGGGGAASRAGGGGGAGGMLVVTSTFTEGYSEPITIGAGGVASPGLNQSGGNGGTTVYYGLNLVGGGGGGGYNAAGNGGGSGGGSGFTSAGGTGTSGQGNAGGTGGSGAGYQGGGGGKGSAGGNRAASGAAGTGYTISGYGITIAQGGAGGTSTSNTNGAAGSANTGNGAGGGFGTGLGGAGGSGVVIINVGGSTNYFSYTGSMYMSGGFVYLTSSGTLSIA